jgi:hypothetical protein
MLPWRILRGCCSVCVLTLLASLPGPGVAAQTAPPLSPRNANYQIAVTLNPRTRELRASEVIRWRNITRNPTRELQFHLYWNAWVDTRSTWMRETGRRREVDRPDADFAQFTIDSMRLAGDASGPSTDLLSSGRYIAPDDGNAGDRTVMQVALPREVQPGETINVEISWHARVPRTFDRTGTIGNYSFIAQWFPKLGVLEDQGWNCHQFHAQTEFFSDYGTYDVTITVPTGWVVGATGTVRDQRDDGRGFTSHRYVQDDVHDFAWTTSPDFIVRSARFDESGLPPVEMRLLIQPEHLSQVERHFAAARSALRRYGAWFGAYPYGHLTIVDPAWQSGSDGMEYPTLFTAGTHWLITPAVTLQTPEEVVLHEAGHQFWYGIVGSNEFEHAWLDEGINTYATARALAADFPNGVYDRYYFGGFIPWVFRDVRFSRETDYNRLWDFRRGATDDSLSAPSYRQRPETVRFFAYDKPAVWLNTLERWLGWPVVQHALNLSFRDGAFGHPAPEVVLGHLQQAAGRDLTTFFDQTYRGSAVFDYAVEELTSARRNDQYETRVLVRRLGDGLFPVDIQVTFENGDVIRESWDGSARWRELTYTRRSRAVSAVVDPERTLLLDVNFTNNSRTLRPQADAAATKWTLKWVVWLQDALLSWGLFA